jgi:hypothetical protein
MTHADLIEAKGGAAKVAEAIAVPAVTVRMWKYRRSIPRAAYAELLQAFPDITLDMLKAGETSRLAA